MKYEKSETRGYFNEKWKLDFNLPYDKFNAVLNLLNNTKNIEDIPEEIKELNQKIRKIQKEYIDNLDKLTNEEYEELILNKTFDRMLDDFNKRRYLLLDFEETYSSIDENKLDKIRKMRKDLIKMYEGEYTNFNSILSDNWNKYVLEDIPKENIKQIVDGDKEDVYSIINEIYSSEEFKDYIKNVPFIGRLIEYKEEKEKNEDKKNENKNIEKEESDIKKYRKYRKNVVEIKRKRDEDKLKEKTYLEKVEEKFYNDKFNIKSKDEFFEAVENIKNIKIKDEEINLNEETVEYLEKFKSDVDQKFKEELDRKMEMDLNIQNEERDIDEENEKEIDMDIEKM